MNKNQSEPVLAKRSWGDAKVFQRSDLLDSKVLEIVLGEFESHELEITDEGFKFLEQNFGIGFIVNWYFERYSRWKTREEVQSWWEERSDTATY